MEMTKRREFSTLSPKQNMNIWKINLNSLPASAPKHTIFHSHFWFFTFSRIFIYSLTLLTLSAVLLACVHWFTVKSVLIPPVCLFWLDADWKWKFFLPIQGCESEITSMVTEASRKSSRCLDAALLALGHLAAMTGMPLNAMEQGTQATGKVTPTLIPQQLLSMSTLLGSL